MLDPTVHAQLAALVPPSALLASPEETRPYECDGLTLYRAQAAAVLLPEDEAQVVGILKVCHEARVPVVARGAGTGLSGGAMPDPRGIVLSLAKFRRILAIDPLARTAVVQPGVRNLAISEAAASTRPLLRAGSVVADRLHHRRQRRRERRRRPLPQVRPHRAQRPPRARRHHRRRHRRVRRRRARLAGLRPAGADQRFRGPARGDHRGHRQADAEAAARAGRAGRVRRRRQGRRRGRRGDRGRHHSRAASR